MNWKKLISNIAPTIGAALGGPLAGGAIKALSSALLGKEDANEEEVEAAVCKATPDQLAKIKEIEGKFKTDMAKIGVDLEKIAADDRDSARKREIAVKDRMPAILASAVIIGFFGILISLAVIQIPEKQAQIYNIMIGVLGGMATSVISYYFGSSSGSREKNQLLKNK